MKSLVLRLRVSPNPSYPDCILCRLTENNILTGLPVRTSDDRGYLRILLLTFYFVFRAFLSFFFSSSFLLFLDFLVFSSSSSSSPIPLPLIPPHLPPISPPYISLCVPRLLHPPPMPLLLLLLLILSPPLHILFLWGHASPTFGEFVLQLIYVVTNFDDD